MTLRLSFAEDTSIVLFGSGPLVDSEPYGFSSAMVRTMNGQLKRAWADSDRSSYAQNHDTAQRAVIYMKDPESGKRVRVYGYVGLGLRTSHGVPVTAVIFRGIGKWKHLVEADLPLYRLMDHFYERPQLPVFGGETY